MADERLVPARGLVAIEAAQEVVIRSRGKNRLDLERMPDSVRRRPRRQKPGVNEQQPSILHRQRTPSQPVEQVIAVGCFENRCERVQTMRGTMPRGDNQKMQIVIAENRRRRGAERLHAAQHGQRVGSTIDQIADQPQAIARKVEANQVEQLREFGVATLDITDDVVAHARGSRWRSAGRCAGLPQPLTTLPGVISSG